MAFVTTPTLVESRPVKRRRHAPLCSLETRKNIAACTGPTCKQANSANILLTLQELCSDADDITVQGVGCLGECGNGPNVGISCVGTTPTIRVGVRSLRDVADLVRSVGHNPSGSLLEALEKKERGDELFGAGDVQGAVAAYGAAVEALQSRPRLLARVLCNRSAALLEAGLGDAAKQDANDAVGMEPGLAGAWKRKAEAHEVLKETDMAVQAWNVWGNLAGTPEEASRRVRKLRGWRFAVFGQ